MDLTNAVFLDMDELAVRHGATFVSIVRDDNGETIRLPYWSEEQLAAMLADVKERVKGADKVIIENRASYAYFCALVHAVYPRPCFQHVLPHGPLKHEIFESFLTLEQGDYAPEGKILFDVREEGNDVFIRFKVDDGTEAGHAYDDALLPLVKAPVVAPGKRVFITGITKYSIAVSIAEAYRDTASSCYMLYRADTEYICAWSNNGSDVPGSRFKPAGA